MRRCLPHGPEGREGEQRMRPLKKISQKAIAERLGISHVSVSNALAGRKGVSRELRERVLETAARMEYEAKQESGSGSAGQSEIAVVGAREIPERLSTRNRVHFRCDLPDVLSGDIGEAQLREWQSCIGILVTRQVSAEVLRMLGERVKKPMVGIGFFVGGVPMDFVMEDGFHGIQALARTLRDRGYTRLVYVSPEEAEANLEERSMLEDRLLGFRRDQYTRLLENAEKVETVPAFDLGERDGIVTLHRLPERLAVWRERVHGRQPRTALICGDGRTARRAAGMLRMAGIAVPGEIGVIGCGAEGACQEEREDGGTQACRETVSMFRADEEQLMERAVRILKERREGRAEPEGLHHVPGAVVRTDTI